MFRIINSLRTRKTQRERGFSLSLGEGILVFIVAGLVIALGYKLFSSLMASFRANKITNELQLVIPRIQTAYSNSTDFANLNAKVVARSRWVSDSMIDNSTANDPKVKTQWGDIEFTPNGNQVTVKLDNIPSRECAIIAESFSGHMIKTAKVGAVEVKKAGENNVLMDKIGEGCAASATNTIEFVFGRA